MTFSINFWILTALAFLSRIITINRTLIQIQLLGDSSLSDIFSLTISTLSIFRRIFIDGSFESIISIGFLKAKKRLNEGVFLRSTLKRYTIVFSAFTLLFIFCSPIFAYIYRLNGEQYNLFLFFSMFLSPNILLMFWSSFFNIILNSEGKFFKSSLASLIGNLIFTSVLFLFGSKWTISSLIIGNFLYAWIQTVIMVIFEWKLIRKNIHTPAEEISCIEENKMNKKSMDGDVLKSSFGQIIVPISHTAINYMAATMETGSLFYYDYGYKITLLIYSFFCEPLLKNIIPEISKIFIYYEDKKQIIWDFILVCLVINMPIVMFLYNLEVKDFLKIPKFILGNRLTNPNNLCISVVKYSPSIILMSLIRIFNALLTVNKKQTIVSINNWIFGLLNIFFSFLWKDMGFYGLIQAYNIALLIQLLVLFISVLFCKILKIEKSFSLDVLLLVFFFSFIKISLFVQIPIYIIIFRKYFKFLFKKNII